MSSKIDTTTSFRDRQESRSEKATSNATYVKDLKDTNSLNPPKKLFKEDADYIRRSTTTPKKDSTTKTSKEHQELTILKEKFKENASGKLSPEKKTKKKELTTEITAKMAVGVDAINALLENSKLSDQGPQVKLYDSMERFELAQNKYLEIKQHLPEKTQNQLELRLEKMRKAIEELVRKVSGSAIAGMVLRPENEEEGEGTGLGGIKDKLSEMMDMGLMVPIGKKDDKNEDEDAGDDSGSGIFGLGKKRDDKEEETN
jgi:hypothetical protein